MDSNSRTEPPRFLYRYRPMSEHLLAEIENNTIFLAPLNGRTLNDPLEGKFNFADSNLDDFRDELMRLALEEGVAEFALWINFLPKEELARMHADAKAIGERFMQPEERWGVACFTGRLNNKKMWREYADQENGVVLEYDLGQSEVPFGAICKVKYTRRRGRTSVVGALASSSEGEFSEVLAHKTPKWAYEEEWRILCDARGVVKLKIPISRVIIGPRMSTDDKNRVVQAMVRNGTPSLAELVPNGEDYILLGRVRGHEPVRLV